jgi:hypothetical protein
MKGVQKLLLASLHCDWGRTKYSVLDVGSTSGVEGGMNIFFKMDFLNGFKEDVVASIDNLLHEVKNTAPNIMAFIKRLTQCGQGLGL